MDYLGLILFLWILGGTGLIVMWADRLLQQDRSEILFRTAPQRLERAGTDLR